MRAVGVVCGIRLLLLLCGMCVNIFFFVMGFFFVVVVLGYDPIFESLTAR